MPFRYPIALELEGRRCVVIGGGEVAEHKTRALLEAGADVFVISEAFTPGLEQLSLREELQLIKKTYSNGDLEAAFLAIAATDDPAVNTRIYAEAEERKVLLNAVDDIDNCHFAVPSIVRRGEFLLAISTGGKAPALSKRLRQQLSKQFGADYGVLVNLLGEVRDQTLPERQVDFDTWAKRWQLALDQDLLGLIESGRIGEARELVRQCVENGVVSPDQRPVAGRVWIVGAGPGDPQLITLRASKLLDSADVVVYDRLVHPALVEGRNSVFVGKQPGHKQVFSQAEINALLVKLALEGKRVVRLKGGDPFIFGRGGEEAEALAEAGIEFEVVPAPTSAVAALAYAGIPVTDRRYSSSVAFVTGHCSGDLKVDWQKLATSVDTIVVLMGLTAVDQIVAGLLEGGLAPNTPAAIVSNGTLASQQVIVCEAAELPEAAARSQLKPPAVIVIGEVVRLREKISWFQDSTKQKQQASANKGG